MKQLSEISTSIRKFAEGRTEIATVYLFGSVLTSKRPNDIDIGLIIRMEQVDETAHPYGYLADVVSELMAALHRSDIDVVILNRASPVIGMQVLRKGRKVFERDSRLSNEFAVQTLGRYDDLKRVRRPIERAILNGRIYG